MKSRLLLDLLISSMSSDIKTCRLSAPEFRVERRPQELWRQKVFCILSSQFDATKAAAISERFVCEVPVLDRAPSLQQLQETCFDFLRSPSVRYRFPKTKATQISLCWFPFAQVKDEYQEYIRSFQTEEAARANVIKTFPGMGLKQASMFLRNIGAAQTLSVIDVHIRHYLRIFYRWDDGPLTPRRYFKAEERMRRDALRYDLPLNVFDTVVWAASRALKRASVHV